MTEPAHIAEYVCTFGSLFSGIGGIDLGLERAGWTCRWQAEIDPYASKVLAKHWPHVPNIGDVREVNWEDDGLDYGDGIARSLHVDLVCGGFPCQPVSHNGHGLAQDDERWLWPEFARCLRHVRPRFVVVENVPALTARGLGDVLTHLADLRYDTEWDVLPASAFGAPHRRERLFVLAYPHGFRREEDEGVLSVHSRQELGESGAWGEVSRRGVGGRVRPFPDPLPDGVADGFPAWLDRLRCLGNAVVPQVAEWIGRRLMSAHFDGCQGSAK